jgi:FeS assembly SUF system protein
MNTEADVADVADAASLPQEKAATNDSSAPDLEASIIEVLRTCYDPEIPVNIYEMGLIYGIDVKPSGEVDIRMTLTSPGCPVAGSLPGEVEQKVQSVPGVTNATVELVWDPPWCMDLMSEAAKLQLGMF